MKTIIVPTDFTPDSEKALLYAIELNKKLNLRILLFHAFNIPVPVADFPMPLTSEEEMHASTMQTLNALKKKYADINSGMKFNTAAEIGNSTQEIVDKVNKEEVSYIVMGSHGVDPLQHLMMGKHVPGILDKVDCPVIIVPREAEFRWLNKIVFATNFGKDDLENIISLINFASTFDAEILILHITKDADEKMVQFAEGERFTEQVAQISKYEKLNFKLLEGKDVFDSLNMYMEEIKADMLVINKHERSMFERIFTISLTRKMTYNSHIPLMAFHTRY